MNMQWLDRLRAAVLQRHAPGQPVGPEPGLMSFSDSHVRSVRHESETSPPDAANCLEVVRVGRLSPASRAGVTVKHLLVSVDGSPAAPQAEVLPLERRQDYVFYSRDLCQTT